VGREASLFLRGLSEQSQEIADEKDDENGSKADAGSASSTPTAIAVVASATAEHKYQNNDEYDEHFLSPSIRVVTTVSARDWMKPRVN
jgi:hypothetical protein